VTVPHTTTAGQQTTKVYPTTNYNTVVASNPYGKADLAVTILSYGTLDKSTNAYTATSTAVNRSNRIAVRFEVANRGDKTSPTWMFNGYLPTFPAQTFNSDQQSALNPGDKIEFTIGFDQMQDSATSIVKIEVDPANNVTESDKTNNTASISIPTIHS
jgi:hypothetical protein